MDQKPYKTIDEQVEILKDRGLIISDEDYAKRCLTQLNYYRLSGYTLTLRKNNSFYKNITFENVMDIYNFDRQLKLYVLNYLKDIEISLRTHIGYILGSMDSDKPAYLNAGCYISDAHYNRVLEELKDALADSKNEAFVKHHQTKYRGSLPSWVMVETLSFGALSRLFSSLKQDIKCDICDAYYNQIRPQVVENLLEGLVVLRNICAHHSRIYNRGIPNTPKMSKVDNDFFIDNGYERNEIGKKLFFRLVIIDRLIEDANFLSKMISDIDALSYKYPFVQLRHYGFKADWKNMVSEINKQYK